MAELAAPKLAEEELLRMTTEVVAAYVSNNTLATTQLGEIIHAVYNSLRGLDGQPVETQTEALKPAVPESPTACLRWPSKHCHSTPSASVSTCQMRSRYLSGA